LVNRSTSYRIEPITMTSNSHDQSGPKKHLLIRWRNQGGKLRAYAELRSLGGGRRALIPPGETRATTDPETAEILDQCITSLKVMGRAAAASYVHWRK
jgi:hypothetical protein